VASEVRRWHDAESGPHWNECAVLYRTNQQSDAIQAAFTLAQVPYSLPEGQITMLERAEIKHMLAYASLAVNQDDGWLSPRSSTFRPGRSARPRCKRSSVGTS
jgi:superfamily I DNA/RNA helicase